MIDGPPPEPLDRGEIPGPAAVRIRQIAEVTAELGAAETLADVVDAAVLHGNAATSASRTTLVLREDDLLRIVGAQGLAPRVAARWETFPLAAPTPIGEAVRTARPVVLPPGDHAARYPEAAADLTPEHALVLLPLGPTAPAVGAIGLAFASGWTPGPVELDFLSTFAQTCGLAIRRIRAADRADARARHLSFLSQVSAELARSLDYRQTLTNVANLTVPDLADWCAVEIVENGATATLAVAHVDPRKVEWAWELQEKYPTDPEALTGSPHVIRTGISEFYRELTDDMLVAGARDEEHLRLSRELDLHSAIVVPLVGRDGPLGAMTLIRTSEHDLYDDADLALAEDAGRRAGMAIDNARLYARSQDVALQLQRAVLPAVAPVVPGWETASHYSPGGRGGVGGDFYDAVDLDDDVVAFAIGDVMGHGIEAAASMAQMRAAIRAYVSTIPDPGTVVDKLDRMFARLHMTQMVTLVYGLIDPRAQTLTYVNAGHYPPLLVRADGTVTTLPEATQVAVGVGGDDRVATTVAFAPGDTLLLYTDGAVEHRNQVLDVGMSRLRELSAALASGDLATSLDTVVRSLGARDIDDDVTLFAVRAVRPT